jgi:hypothetical protein
MHLEVGEFSLVRVDPPSAALDRSQGFTAPLVVTTNAFQAPMLLMVDLADRICRFRSSCGKRTRAQGHQLLV